MPNSVRETIVKNKRIIPVILAVVAIVLYMIPTNTLMQASARIINSGNGGIGGAGGAGGAGGFGGMNSCSRAGCNFEQSGGQQANGGNANGGYGGSANGGNIRN